MPQKTYSFLAPKDMKDMIEFTAKNFDNPNNYLDRDRANALANKWGLTAEDLNMYRSSAWLPPEQMNPIRANVFDKVAAREYAVEGLPSPIGGWDRFNVIGLISEDPDLQVKYLQKKNYKARYNPESGRVEAAKPGDFFRPVDPTGWDIGDVIDVIPEAVNMVVEGFVTGARFLTGPGGYTLTAPVGAATSAGLETGWQAVANLTGARDDYDFERIARQGLAGAVFPLIPKIPGRTLKNVSEGYKFIPKENIADIKAAGEAMGAIPTRGMLNAERRGQELEDKLWNQRPVNLYNKDVINQIDQNITATDKYATDLLKGRSGASTVDAAEQIQEGLSTKLQAKLKRSEDLYDDIQKKLSLPGFRVDSTPLSQTLDVLGEGFKFDPIGRNWVNNIREEMANIRTIEDLRGFNRRLYNDERRYKLSDPSLAGASQILANRSKTLIDETFNSIIDQKAMDISKISPQKAQEFEAYINGLRNNLKEANKLYYEVNQEANAILRRPKSPIQEKGSAKTKIEKIEGQSLEKTFRDVYAKGDIKKARWMEQNYPEEIAMAKAARMQELWDRATKTQKSAGKQSLGSKISDLIKNLKPSEKEILFGKEGIKKADYLATWFAEKPIVVNPSGTSKGIEMNSWLGYFNNVPTAMNAFGYWMTKPNNPLRGLVTGVGYAIDNPLTRGASYGAGSQLLLPKNEASEKYTFP